MKNRWEFFYYKHKTKEKHRRGGLKVTRAETGNYCISFFGLKDYGSVEQVAKVWQLSDIGLRKYGTRSYW